MWFGGHLWMERNRFYGFGYITQWLFWVLKKIKFTTKCIHICQMISVAFEWIRSSHWIGSSKDAMNSLCTEHGPVNCTHIL
jgi:hypothetical protein